MQRRVSPVGHASERLAGRRARIWSAMALGAALLALALTGSAHAAPGDLTLRDCIADGGASGCAPAPSLDGAEVLAPSPDGASLYVASFVEGSVTTLARGAGGQLGFQGCVADGGAAGCAAVGSLAQAEGVVVSPDGRSVYATSLDEDTVSIFTRAANGALTYAGCLAPTAGPAGCAAVPSLDGPLGIAVSPDGTSVYVASFDGEALTHLSRGPDGSLAFASCHATVGAYGCQPAATLNGAWNVAVSPDGASVYVTAADADTVSIFSRGANGVLALTACFVDVANFGCAPATTLDEPVGLAISPDGRSVYVAATGDDAVTTFARAGDGTLAIAGCVAEGGASGCSPAGSLDGAFGVAVAPDGTSAYVASLDDDSLTTFSRAAAGGLTPRGCFAEGGASGCAPAGSLDGAIGVAVSPDGASVYVAANVNNAVTHLARELPSAPAGPAAGPGPASVRPAAGAVPRCGGRRATIVARGPRTVGTPRADVIVGRAGPDRILGLGGQDVICGRGGPDLLSGGSGRDRLIGGGGSDSLRGGGGRDLLLGGPGRDLLVGGAGRDSLLGGLGADRQRQ